MYAFESWRASECLGFLLVFDSLIALFLCYFVYEELYVCIDKSAFRAEALEKARHVV